MHSQFLFETIKAINIFVIFISSIWTIQSAQTLISYKTHIICSQNILHIYLNFSQNHYFQYFVSFFTIQSSDGFKIYSKK